MINPHGPSFRWLGLLVLLGTLCCGRFETPAGAASGVVEIRVYPPCVSGSETVQLEVVACYPVSSKWIVSEPGEGREAVLKVERTSNSPSRITLYVSSSGEDFAVLHVALPASERQLSLVAMRGMRMSYDADGKLMSQAIL